MDITRKVVATQQHSLTKGKNIVRLDIGGLEEGMYFLQSNSSIVSKFIKIKD